MPVVIEPISRRTALVMLAELLPESAWAIVQLNRPRPFGSYRCHLLRTIGRTGAILHVECRDRLFEWRAWMLPLPGPAPDDDEMHTELVRRVVSGRSRIVHGPAEQMQRISDLAGGLPIGRWHFVAVDPSQLHDEPPEWLAPDPAVRRARVRDLPALLRFTFPFEDRFVRSPGQLLGYWVARIAQRGAFLAEIDGEMVAMTTTRDAGNWLVIDHGRVLPSQRGQYWSLRIMQSVLAQGNARPLVSDYHTSPHDHSRDLSWKGYGRHSELRFVKAPRRAAGLAAWVQRAVFAALGSQLPQWKAARFRGEGG